MIVNTVDGKTIDTESLSPEERHALQKLFLWESMVNDLEQFRQKKAEAVAAGWNNSKIIIESPAFKKVIEHLEKKILIRLSAAEKK